MSNKPNTAVKSATAPKSKGAELAAAANKRRREELEDRRRKAQQQQRTILFIGAVAVLIVVVVAVILLSQPPSATFADGDLNAPYVGIPVGTTQTGPNASIKYPIAFPYLGNPNAPVKIEEIASFSCPYCLQYHDSTITSITDEIKAGRAQYIYIFTTNTGDYNAIPGTYAAVCAMQQNMFWPMEDILFNWQKTYAGGAADTARLRLAAQHLGLDMGKYDTCVSSKATADYVAASNDYANARGLVGTPSIFVFVKGIQLMPPAGSISSGQTPGSMAGLSLGNLRGVIESASLPTPVATAAATSAATAAATQVATTPATSAPTAVPATAAATAKS